MSAVRLRLRGLVARVAERELLRGVDLDLSAGRLVGLVGASGSGKTLTARALLGLVDLEPGIVGGELEIEADGVVYRPYPPHPASSAALDRAFAPIRGRILGWIPQNPGAALDPMVKVGAQIEAVRDPEADGLGRLLERVRLTRDVADAWPHELSGGMAQRVVIAQALAGRSRLLIADEPTSALDPTVQAEILADLRALCDRGLGVLLVTHDLRVLPGIADEVVVMDAGRIVERVTAAALVGGHVAAEPTRRLWEATRRVAGGRLG